MLYDIFYCMAAASPANLKVLLFLQRITSYNQKREKLLGLCFLQKHLANIFKKIYFDVFLFQVSYHISIFRYFPISIELLSLFMRYTRYQENSHPENSHPSNSPLEKSYLEYSHACSQIFPLEFLNLLFFHYGHRHHWYYLKDCLVILSFKSAEVRNSEIDVSKKL